MKNVGFWFFILFGLSFVSTDKNVSKSQQIQIEGNFYSKLKCKGVLLNGSLLVSILKLKEQEQITGQITYRTKMLPDDYPVK